MPEVTIVPTGERFATDPREPVLAAALRAGLNLPHSCKGGHCASCRARVLSGRFEYPGGDRPVGLTDQEAADGYALLCEAVALTDLTVETRQVLPAAEIEVKSLPCRIERLERLTEDVISVSLRLPAVEELHFRAGQYLDFVLSGGRRRSFSIANAPSDGRQLEVHVRRASSTGFTAQLFDTVHPGTLLRIEGPLGQFWFRNESPRPAIMVGGGTGYAPLRAMLRQLLVAGDRRRITLYWGARAPRDLYEHDWLGQLASVRAGFDYRPVLSGDAGPDWQGRRGLVHEALFDDHADLSQYDVYASGPPAMVEAIRAGFAARGLPREQLFFDSFDYAPDTLAAMRAQAAAAQE